MVIAQMTYEFSVFAGVAVSSAVGGLSAQAGYNAQGAVLELWWEPQQGLLLVPYLT
jgi:hypothetical protein